MAALKSVRPSCDATAAGGGRAEHAACASRLLRSSFNFLASWAKPMSSSLEVALGLPNNGCRGDVCCVVHFILAVSNVRVLVLEVLFEVGMVRHKRTNGGKFALPVI